MITSFVTHYKDTCTISPINERGMAAATFYAGRNIHNHKTQKGYWFMDFRDCRSICLIEESKSHEEWIDLVKNLHNGLNHYVKYLQFTEDDEIPSEIEGDNVSKYKEVHRISSDGRRDTVMAVFYSGAFRARDGLIYPDRYFQVFTMKGKANIHMMPGTSRAEFVRRLELIRHSIYKYLTYLRNEDLEDIEK